MSTVVAFTSTRSHRSHGDDRDHRSHRDHRIVAPVVSSAPSANSREGQVATEVDWSRVAPARIRLTRRGRVVVAVAAAIVLAFILGGGVALLGHQALAGEQPRPVTAAYRVVLPGETLWSIAGEVAPGADRRDVVARIVEFNALATPGVQSGQKVAIPSDLAGR